MLKLLKLNEEHGANSGLLHTASLGDGVFKTRV